jgi:hypothetical protein
MNFAAFEHPWLTIVRMESNPSDLGKSVMRSIDTSWKGPLCGEVHVGLVFFSPFCLQSTYVPVYASLGSGPYFPVVYKRFLLYLLLPNLTSLSFYHSLLLFAEDWFESVQSL